MLDVFSTTLEHYKSGMEKFVRTLSGHHGVRLVFKGTQPMTDGKTIYVPNPSLLDRKDLTEQQKIDALALVKATFGWICHEVGHIIVDLEFMQNYKHEPTAAGFKHMVNVLLDLRMEEILGKMYPGVAESLAETYLWEVAQKEARGVDVRKQSPFSQLCNAIWMIGKYTTKDPESSPLYTRTLPDVLAVANDFKREIQQLGKLPRSEDVEDLAKRLLARIKEEDEKEEEQHKEKKDKQEGQQGEGDEQQQSGGGDQKPGEEPSGSGEQEQDDSKSPSEEAVEDKKGEGGKPKKKRKKKKLQEGMNEAQQSGHGEELADALRQLVTPDPTGERSQYVPYTTEHDVYEHPKVTLEMREKLHKQEQEIGSLYGKMERRLQHLLAANHVSYQVRGLDEGEIDTDALHLLTSGASSSVFQETIQGRDLKGTALAFLLDSSHSMEKDTKIGNMDDKITPTRQVALLCGKALDSVGCAFAVYSHTTTGKLHDPAMLQSDHYRESLPYNQRDLFGRFGGLLMVCYKSFQEKWTPAKPRLSEFGNKTCCNYDGEAVQHILRELRIRTEPRKVLVVISDGLPSGEFNGQRMRQPDYIRYIESSHRKDANHLLHTIQDARKAGIEVLGVGILSPASRRFYEYEKRGKKVGFINVDNVRDFPSTFTKALQDMLLVKG
jgi:cobalamin biosynthesis protein CobT